MNTVALAFDRLAYIDRLTSAGIDKAQARAHAAALETALGDSVATSMDVKDLRAEVETLGRDLRGETGTLGRELRVEIETLGRELPGEIGRFVGNSEARSRRSVETCVPRYRTFETNFTRPRSVSKPRSRRRSPV